MRNVLDAILSEARCAPGFTDITLPEAHRGVTDRMGEGQMLADLATHARGPRTSLPRFADVFCCGCRAAGVLLPPMRGRAGRCRLTPRVRAARVPRWSLWDRRPGTSTRS